MNFLQSLERVFPRRGGGAGASAGPGRAGWHGSGPGPARAGRAALPRSGRSPRGPRLPALRPLLGLSHAARGAGAVDAEGCPQASSPSRAALSPSAQSFSLRSSSQREQTRGGGKAVAGPVCQRRSESALTQPDRDSAWTRLSGHVHNFVPPRSERQAAGADTSEPAGAEGFLGARERRDARA